MIDIHTHILPGLDDGAKDMNASINLLREAEKQGIGTVFATPHFIPGLYQPTVKEIKQTMDSLQEQLNQEEIALTLIMGAEINIETQFNDDEIMSYSLNSGKKYILLELPFVSYPLNIDQRIGYFQSRGFTPIIAHPERAFLIIKNPDKVKEWRRKSVLFQINSKSITGKYGPMVKDTALRMLKNGLVDFVASDAHSNKWGFDFNEVRPILEKIVGKPKTKELLGQNARRLLLTE